MVSKETDKYFKESNIEYREALEKHQNVLKKIIRLYIQEYGLKEPININLIFSDDKFKKLIKKLSETGENIRRFLSPSYDEAYLIHVYEQRGGGGERNQIEEAKVLLPLLYKLINENGSDATLGDIVKKINEKHSPEDLKMNRD